MILLSCPLLAPLRQGGQGLAPGIQLSDLLRQALTQPGIRRQPCIQLRHSLLQITTLLQSLYCLPLGGG